MRSTQKFEIRWDQFGIAMAEFLNRPSLVATCAFGLAAAIVIFDGSLYQLWNLERDREQIIERINVLKETLSVREKELKQTQRLDFIEAQARENLDLVREGELVFVFPDVQLGNTDDPTDESVDSEP